MAIVTMYRWDSQGYYLDSLEVDEDGQLPPQSTTKKPPATTGVQVAQWDGSGWFIVEGGIPQPPDPVMTPEQVDIERDRRINSGFVFAEKLIQSRDSNDRENISGAMQLAFQAIVGGAQAGDYRWADPEVPFQWITADNSLINLDAQDTVAMARTAAAVKQSLVFKARALKIMSPIPLDYTDDKWW